MSLESGKDYSMEELKQMNMPQSMRREQRPQPKVQAEASITEQQPTVLYTMPQKTLEKLENILNSTLSLQNAILQSQQMLATKESLKPLATQSDLYDWMDQMAESNQKQLESAKKILSEMKEQTAQDGKMHGRFSSTLSEAERTFAREAGELISRLQMRISLTILGSAAISILTSVLICLLLAR